MKIHKSFSKLELIDIFKMLNNDFIIDRELNKKEVIEFIEKKIRSFKIINTNNKYNITTIKELKKFLKNENANKLLSVKDKSNVILQAKRIINYCENNYDIDLSTFSNFEEIEKATNEIKNYHYISSVRKAINKINGDTKLKEKIKFNNVNLDVKPQYTIKIRKGIFRYDMLNCKLEVIEEY